MESQNYTKIKNYSNNSISNNSAIDDNAKILLFGIIFILSILLILSIIILIFLWRKKKSSISNNNIILNRISLKNQRYKNNNFDNKKGFQKLQNTSNVSDSMIQQSNVLNEIKAKNIKEENKIIQSLNLMYSPEKDNKMKRMKNNISGENKEVSFDSKNIINDGKNIIQSEEVNTQELEKEIKEQIKKYVSEENNI